jgi:alkylhydroperoxidase family enzyme
MHRHAQFELRLRESVLGPAGHSHVGIRANAAAYAANLDAAGLPQALRTYVDRVARYAYRITDAEIEALKRAGYSEDAIFEVTVAAALGAGLHRLQRGLAALKGES